MQGDGLTNIHMLEHATKNGVLWSLIGIPATLAWVGAGLAVLLAPHFATEVFPMAWAFWGAASWFGLLVLVYGGWLGLLLLASS